MVYGSETWPMKKEDLKRSERAEHTMIRYRHGIGKMPWRSKCLAFPNSPVVGRKGIRAIKTPLQLQDSDPTRDRKGLNTR